jgi:hypothetical protein
MKDSIVWLLSISGMIVLGVLAALYAQDLVWLIVPPLAVVIMLYSFGKIFRS